MQLNAVTNIQTTPRFNELSKGITASIIKNIDLIHGLLLKAAIPTRPYSLKAVEILSQLTPEQHEKILKSLQTWSQIISSIDPEVEPEIEDFDEIEMAGKALKYFGFKTKDDRWKTTASDEIIEIYNADGIQLYRSMNFFNTCGYSLLDLCVNEWFVLWERPRRVVEQMNEALGKILKGEEADVASIPRHIIRETYDDGTTQPFHPRSMLVEFRAAYPFYNQYDEIAGLIVTTKAKVLSVGDEALKLDFI